MLMVLLVIRMIAGAVVVVVMRMVVMGVVVVFVLIIVIMSMPMRVANIALRLHIRAALGIERRFERDDAGPESFGHRLDDRIAADAQRLRQYFGRQMAVAEVPGDADQGHRINGPDLGQRFGLGDHLDDASVLKAQSVAAAQHCRFREVEQEFEPADTRHGHATAIALVEVEHHRVGRNA